MSNPPTKSRCWLSWWLQERRRQRAAVVKIVLSSDGHGWLNWTCNAKADFGYSIGFSHDGISWNDVYDGTAGVMTRDCSGILGYFRVARSNGAGGVLLPYSNPVQSDGV